MALFSYNLIKIPFVRSAAKIYNRSKTLPIRASLGILLKEIFIF